MQWYSTAQQCYKLQQVIHTSSSHRGQHSQWRHLWHLILTVSKKTVIVDWIDMHVHYVYIYCYCLLWKISMWNGNSLPPCQLKDRVSRLNQNSVVRNVPSTCPQSLVIAIKLRLRMRVNYQELIRSRLVHSQLSKTFSIKQGVNYTLNGLCILHFLLWMCILCYIN